MQRNIRKKLIVALEVIVVVAAALGFYYWATPYNKTSAPALNINAGLSMEAISIGTNNIHVEVASNDAQREQGLSNRNSLAKGHGMLFVFDPMRSVGFWMKDMRFDLDIIFAQKDGTIIKIDTNVAADSYPHIFPSGAPIRYVLEVPAGYTEVAGIAVGQKIVVQ